MKKLLNKKVLEQAIADIKAAGNKPTIERIRKITGGSPKTIIAIKRLLNDNEHDNVLSSNDNKHDNKNDNALSLHDIKKLIDTSINQKFEQLKSELLDTIKKNDFDVNNSTPELVQENQDLHQQIKSIETDYRKLEDEYRTALDKLDELDDLLLQNKQQAETIEQLKADVIRLEEAKKESESRSKEAEQARMDAVKEVVKLASENTELRRKLEHENEPAGSTEPETKSLIIEPENKPEIKFTLGEAKARFFELRKDFPEKKQKEYLRILDSEGYTNTEGNSVGAYNLNRWEKQQRLK